MLTLLFFRDDPRNALEVELRQLSEQNNVVDIIKLLVAYALRIGAVKQTTWESLIASVMRRPSRQFI